MTRTKWWALLAVCLAGACARTSALPQTRLDINEFVNVMVELQLAQPEGRPAVLKKHRTSEQELREFVSAWSAQPRLLGLAYDTIQSRVERARFNVP